MADINRRASLLACYLLILSILRRRRARRIPRRHRFWVRQIYEKKEELGASFFLKYRPYAARTFLYFFFLCFSRVQPEFLSYCFPDIHPCKLILIVLKKIVINCRIFLHFSIKRDVFKYVFSAAILKWST